MPTEAEIRERIKDDKAYRALSPWEKTLTPFIVHLSQTDYDMAVYVRGRVTELRAMGEVRTVGQQMLAFFTAGAEYKAEAAEDARHECIQCPVCGGYARVYRGDFGRPSMWCCDSEAHRWKDTSKPPVLPETGTGTVSGLLPQGARTAWL